MSIGANIRRLRESHRLTQKELGEIAGVSDKAVSTWEKGIKLPRMGAIERLANYFGVPKSAILDDTVSEASPFAKQLDRLCVAWDRSPQTIERELDLPQGRLAMLRDGSALPFEGELHRLQQYFEMNTPPVTEHPNVVPMIRPATTRRIPVLGHVPAGIPVEAITDIVDEIELDGRIAGDGYDYFALLVTGDSMYPEYRDGDVVIVRMQSTAETGDDVVAYVGGDNATLKRLTLTTSGLQLRPLNAAYPVRSFTHDQVAAGQVTIAGVVVEQRRVRHR